MKKKIIISIIFVLILVIGIVGFIFFNNRTAYTITLDINPSIEINLTKNEKVKNVVALNRDAEKLTNGNFKSKTVKETFKKIVNNLIENEYISDKDLLEIILHADGNISSEILKNQLKEILQEKEIAYNIILIKELSSEDRKLAKKYNVSAAKIAYIKSIAKDRINIENLVNKSVSELTETKENGKYCEKDYILEGDWCLKEISRTSATTGKVCPNGYYEKNDTCYAELPSEEGKHYVCRDEFILEGDQCIQKNTYDALGKCNNGEYENGYCIVKKYIGDATEYCRITPATDILIDHKCYGPKPMINGGCLNGDKIINGSCVDMNSYYNADWICPNGELITNPDSSLMNEDKKCYNIVKTEPTSYYCQGKDKLNGTKCEVSEIEKAGKERVCPNGYTLVNQGRCINYNSTIAKEDGFICDGENTKVRGNTCITYEMVAAKSY